MTSIVTLVSREIFPNKTKKKEYIYTDTEGKTYLCDKISLPLHKLIPLELGIDRVEGYLYIVRQKQGPKH